MIEFVRDLSGAVSAVFETVEVDVLRLALGQLVELLDAASVDTEGASSDPALRRLVPDAYPDDAEAAAEFRRFTAGGILDRKSLNARTVLTTLDAGHEGADGARQVAIVLDDDAIQSWVRTLTDLRLTLAERLDISPDGVVHLRGEDARFLRDVYEWLGMVQESLVYAIDA